MADTRMLGPARKLAFGVLCWPAWAAAQSLTMMPPNYPPSPSEYVCKWDSSVLRPLMGTREPFPQANGRQIARDRAGHWFILVKDVRGVLLASGGKPQAAGAEFAVMGLVGERPSEPGAVFAGQGYVTGASMVFDASGRLHVTWCDRGGLWYVTASPEGPSLERLRDKKSWTQPRRLAEAPSHPGDIMLDPAGEVAVCYSRSDTVYCLPMATGKAESAAGMGAGMAALGGLTAGKGAAPPPDDAKPGDTKAQPARKPSYPAPRPVAERECQQAVMDLAPDGTVYLAFQRDFDIWVARRTREGRWLPADCAARGPAFHPSLVVTGARPLVCFQYEGIKKVELGGKDYLSQRECGGSSIGFAARTSERWSSGYLAKAEEIIIKRQGIWDKMFQGKAVPMVEQLGQPALFRDRHGVAWAVWQNTTRRWAYCARWLGDGFGQVQECRGHFNAPSFPVSAEKLMPPMATDVGVCFYAASRVIFERLKIPTLSASEERQVMFLDCLEVGETAGVDFVLNRMSKHAGNPVLSPGPPGSRDDRHVRFGSVRKHGSTYSMRHQYQSWDDDEWRKDGLAISPDGVRWQKVSKLPDDFPPADPPQRGLEPDDPLRRGYIDNPDESDPAKKFVRMVKCGEVGWARGSYRLQYSPDGKQWTDGPETSVFNAFREGTLPNLWDPLDVPERRIKAYGRTYSANARSCGVMWSPDLLHWSGAEHFLDPDNPYGTPPAVTPVGALRPQVFLDACAGKGEDQIYSCSVRIVEGLYLCDYLPCTFDHRFDVALAVSRDGIHFTRVKNGESLVPVGPAGSWDSGIVMTDLKRGLRDGDVLRLYYDGTPWHHGMEGHSYPPFHVGLATVRVNGFTFYTPRLGHEHGTVTTIPIQSPAGVRRGLTVNVEGATGPARAFAVEVLDAATGEPVKGFGASECVALQNDGLAVPVAWKAGQALPDGKDIRLRFHLGSPRARLYSFGFRALD